MSSRVSPPPKFSLCSLRCSGTHSVYQVGCKLRDLLASYSDLLGSKACATIAH